MISWPSMTSRETHVSISQVPFQRHASCHGCPCRCRREIFQPSQRRPTGCKLVHRDARSRNASAGNFSARYVKIHRTNLLGVSNTKLPTQIHRDSDVSQCQHKRLQTRLLDDLLPPLRHLPNPKSNPRTPRLLPSRQNSGHRSPPNMHTLQHSPLARNPPPLQLLCISPLRNLRYKIRRLHTPRWSTTVNTIPPTPPQRTSFWLQRGGL